MPGANFMSLVAAGESNLRADLWEAHGNHAANVVISNDANGYLVFTFTSQTLRTYARLKTVPAMTNGTCRAIILCEGADTTTDQIMAGPGVRLSGTNAVNDMSGYVVVVRRYGTLSGDPYVWRPQEFTSGATANLGTESASVSGGLGSVYSDLRITVATNGADADVSTDVRREGQVSAEDTDAITDVTPRTGTEWGIVFRDCLPIHTVRVKFVGVS